MMRSLLLKVVCCFCMSLMLIVNSNKSAAGDYFGELDTLYSGNERLHETSSMLLSHDLMLRLSRDWLPSLMVRYSESLSTPADNACLSLSQEISLDTHWAYWQRDLRQSDNVTAPVDGMGVSGNHGREKQLYLYGGVRRSGHHYYALDLSSWYWRPASSVEPVVKFVIRTGSQADLNTPFSSMGESWSTPVLARVWFKRSLRIVLFFGGGYDADYYSVSEKVAITSETEAETEAQSVKGNQIFMVDAESGELLWWASGEGSGADLEVSALQHSIPSQLSVLDLNGNGIADRLYFGDLGGQLFRVNLNDQFQSDALSDPPFARLTQWAALGGVGQSNRQFFSAPSVAQFRMPDGTVRYALAIVSGDQAHVTRSEVDEHLFVLYDHKEGDSADQDAVITLSDLLPFQVDPSQKEGVEADLNSIGWMMPLAHDEQTVGEKSFGSPLFYQGKLILATYVPNLDRMRNGDEGDCSEVWDDLGRSRLYVLEGLTGRAAAKFDRVVSLKRNASGRVLDEIHNSRVQGIHLKQDASGIMLFLGDWQYPIGEKGLFDIEFDRKVVHFLGWQRLR